MIEDFGQGPGFWALTRFDDVIYVSRHPELFCSSRGGTNIGDIPGEMGEFLGSHHQHGRPAPHAAPPPREQRLHPEGAQQAARLGARARARDVVDNVADEGRVRLRERDRRAELPAADHLRHGRASRSRCATPCSSRRTSSSASATPSTCRPFEDLLGAFMTLHQMATELGQQRLDEPTDDITSTLMHAEVDGERLTRHRVRVVLHPARRRRQRDDPHRDQPRDARADPQPRPEGALDRATSTPTRRTRSRRSSAGRRP